MFLQKYDYKKGILKLCIIISFIMLFYVRSRANMFLDSDGNLCFVSADKEKTSSIWYQTIGIDISRGNNEPIEEVLHLARQSFRVDFVTEALKTQRPAPSSGGITYTYFVMPIATIISKASAIDASWGEEIQKAINGEGAVALRGDCIMIVMHGSKPWSGPYRNYAAIDQEYPALHMSNQTLNSRPNPYQIAHAEGWANPSGLKTHFRRWFILGANKADEPISRSIGDDYCITEYRQTKVGQGIPSDKSVINKLHVSKLKGGMITSKKWCGERHLYTADPHLVLLYYAHYFEKSSISRLFFMIFIRLIRFD